MPAKGRQLLRVNAIPLDFSSAFTARAVDLMAPQMRPVDIACAGTFQAFDHFVFQVFFLLFSHGPLLLLKILHCLAGLAAPRLAGQCRAKLGMNNPKFNFPPRRLVI
jgi:hypothetical protein